MDGFEAAAAIRRHEQGTGVMTPIVAVTAHTMAGDRERCLAAGMNAFVSKPLRPDMLMTTINGLLAASAPPRRARRAAAPRRTGTRHGEVIDGAALLEGFGGDRGLLEATIAVFLQDAPQQLAVLDAAIARGHAPDVAQAAHALKGSVGLFSTGRAYAAARRLEMTARRGQTSRFEVQARAVRRAVTTLMPMLAALAAGPAS
jgi:CheY-like chemotaxis protein